MFIFIMVLAIVALVAAIAILGYLYWGGCTADNPAVQRHLVRQEERLAEARIQRVMQDTVQQMFDAVRDQR